MEQATTKYNGVKIVFQRADGLWPIEDKLLNDEEFEKLRAISDCQWQIILWPSDLRGYPEHPEKYTDFSKLKDDTLLRMANAEELTGGDINDLIQNTSDERS